MPGIRLLLLCSVVQLTLARDPIDGYFPVIKTDFPGNEIAINGTTGKQSISISECAALCNANSECLGFTYRNNANSFLSSCHIKSKMTGVGIDNGQLDSTELFSYIKKSIAGELSGYPKHEVGFDYGAPGNDIKVLQDVKDASSCAQECNKTANCAGFVYYPIPFSGQIYNQQATVAAGLCGVKSAMQGRYEFPKGSEIHAYHKSTAASIQTTFFALVLSMLLQTSLRSRP